MASLIKNVAVALAVAVAPDGNKGKNAAFCKKHPKHRQSPGVCSLCLNEKLSQFIAKASSSSSSSSSSSRNKIQISSSSSLSSLSSYCSSSVSSCPSPLHSRYPFSTGGESKGSLLWLTKSRSIACLPRTTVGKKDCGDHDEKMIKRREKRGWLSNLIDPRRIK